MILALPTAIQNWRRNKRDRGLLSVENASAGHVHQNGFRFENVTLVLINTGLHTVSITGYELKVYDWLVGRVLRPPTITLKGNGWKVPRAASQFTLALRPEDSPPIAVKSGEPVRLEIHASTLWPDRQLRKVVAEVRYQPSARPLRIQIKPKDPWSYTDDKGLADQARLLPSLEANQFKGGQWEQIDADDSPDAKRD
jgi:hypothetical protein